MPDASQLLAFTVAALLLAAIPGPGMLYVLARSLGGGRAVGLRSSVGTAVGGTVHVVAATVGLSAILATYNGPVALQATVLGLISVLLNTAADVVVAYVVGPLSRRLLHNLRLWRRQRRATGGLLVGLGIYAAARH